MGEDKQKILTDEERDAFRGTTIDEDGNAYDYGDRERDVLRDKYEKNSSGAFHIFSVHNFGCVVAILILIFLCVLTGFLLPYLLVAAAIYALIRFFK